MSLSQFTLASRRISFVPHASIGWGDHMILAMDGSAFGIGLALGGASILSAGPNSLLILREGMARGHIALVAAAVGSSFFLLLSLSHLLSAQLDSIGDVPRRGLALAGIAVVAHRAARSCFRAVSVRAGPDSGHDSGETYLACLNRVLFAVWTNPLSYLERLILPAALGQSFSSAAAQTEFTTALMLMAALGCCLYALAGWSMGRMLRHDHHMRHFDIASGLITLTIATVSALKLLGGSL
jgi:L-lysine exporter family protein LysE/ArgO